MPDSEKYPETEIYRTSTPFGDEVWVEVDDPRVPSGWKLRRVTTLNLKCTNCGRTTYDDLEYMTPESIARVHCEHCG